MLLSLLCNVVGGRRSIKTAEDFEDVLGFVCTLSPVSSVGKFVIEQDASTEGLLGSAIGDNVNLIPVHTCEVSSQPSRW